MEICRVLKQDGEGFGCGGVDWVGLIDLDGVGIYRVEGFGF